MPFIGTQPEVGGYSVLDALTASATANYTLQLNSANFTPNSANSLLVSLNGVIQKPGSSFTVSGSTLSFSSALTSSDSIDFIIAMGEPLLIGTPSDGTVSTSKIADDAVTGAKIENNPTIAGNLTVSGNFTSIGIDDNADANAMTIDSSERVLIGMTTASGSTDGIQFVKDGRIFSNVNGSAPLILNRKTSDGGIATFRKDGTDIGSIGSDGSDLFIDSSVSNHAGLRFAGGSVLPRYNGSLADNAVDLGQASTDYRFKDLYLSGGVRVGGTGSANYLDDYEEGTWTPAWSNGSGQTYTQQFGTYVKIGRQVMVTCFIMTSDMNGQTGDASVGGLPFTASTGTFGSFPRAWGVVNGDNSWDTNLSTQNLVAQISGGTNLIRPRYNSGFNTSDIQLQQIGGGNSYFGATVVYETDS